MRLAILVVALVFALAGCGGSTKTVTGAQPPSVTASTEASSGPSKADFIEKADTDCQAFKGKLASLQTDLAATKADTSLTADERIARYGKILTPAVTEVRQGVDKLKALRPPQADQAFFRRWIASIEVERDKLAQYTADLTSGDNAGVVDAYRVQGELGSAAATYRGLSQGYGFKVCGAS